MHAPPPPTQRKSVPWVPIIGLLVFGFVVIVGLGAFVGYQFVKTVTSKPEPRKHYGKAIAINKLDEPWSLYRFPDVPMQVELPIAPEAVPLEFNEGDGFHIKGWVFYRLYSYYANYDFMGVWYRSDAQETYEWDQTYLEEYLAESVDVPRLNVTINTASYGKISSGREVTAKATREGQQIKLRCFVWTRGKESFLLSCSFDESYEKEAVAEFKRVVSSIEHR